MASGSLIGLVGDVLVDRENPAEVFSEIREVLAVPDVLFANLEGVYTDTPRPVPNNFSVVSAPAHNLEVYAAAGFDVLSMANNHVLDVGYEAMLETHARLNKQGIRTCGIGEDLARAREPAILEVGGQRIAFLAYASVFPLGYEARFNTPGLAPMRAHNFWRDPFPGVYLPGKQAAVVSVPDELDLRHLTEDITRARETADIVVASFHWGETTRPFFLTDHETRTARYCIDHGVDLVVGHHHHALRGMEWYKGKPILYGLGHFVFDLKLPWSESYEKDLAELLPSASFAQGPYTSAPRKGWPYLPMHEDTRMTALAWAAVDDSGVRDIGFLPCRLTADGFVHPLQLATRESDAVIDYVQRAIQTQNLNGRIVAEGAPTLAGFKTVRVTARK